MLENFQGETIETLSGTNYSHPYRIIHYINIISCSNRRQSSGINNLLTNIDRFTNNGTLNTFNRTHVELNTTISLVCK